MNDVVKEIQGELSQIRERNKKVEAEKAWETSWTRAVSILVITYGVAAAVMYSIGNDRPLVNALIPCVGYFLSTISVPRLKDRWISRNS